jgi:hypothetical protein
VTREEEEVGPSRPWRKLLSRRPTVEWLGDVELRVGDLQAAHPDIHAQLVHAATPLHPLRVHPL